MTAIGNIWITRSFQFTGDPARSPPSSFAVSLAFRETGWELAELKRPVSKVGVVGLASARLQYCIQLQVPAPSGATMGRVS